MNKKYIISFLPMLLMSDWSFHNTVFPKLEKHLMTYHEIIKEDNKNLVFHHNDLIHNIILQSNYPKGMIKNYEKYLVMITRFPEKKLVKISDIIPTATINLKYAQSDNFFKKPVYSKEIAFLNVKACESLKKVQDEMLKDGYRLVIWDAYRPYSVTVLMWNIVKDARYAAPPEKGSRHNRGMAVDVSFEKINGEQVEMPTKFDECKRESSPLFNGISKQARANRDYLIHKMSKYGFKVLNSEWWHFDYKEYWTVPVMDISFESLENHSQ